MNFESGAIDKLLTLSDTELWTTLKGIASMNGVTLPATPPSPAEMQKLRGIFKGGKGLSLEKAQEIVNEYKKGK